MHKDVLAPMLLHYMKSNNLDKKQFAQLLDVSRQTLDNWLDHDNQTVGTTLRMLTILELDRADLAFRADIVIPQHIAKQLSSEDKLELVRLARLMAEKNQEIATAKKRKKR